MVCEVGVDVLSGGSEEVVDAGDGVCRSGERGRCGEREAAGCACGAWLVGGGDGAGEEFVFVLLDPGGGVEAFGFVVLEACVLYAAGERVGGGVEEFVFAVGGVFDSVVVGDLGLEGVALVAGGAGDVEDAPPDAGGVVECVVLDGEADGVAVVGGGAGEVGVHGVSP